MNSRNGQFDHLVLAKVRRAQVARNSHGVNSVRGDLLFGCCSISFPKQFREPPFSIFPYFVREGGSHSWISWCVRAKGCVDCFFLVFQDFFEIHRFFWATLLLMVVAWRVVVGWGIPWSGTCCPSAGVVYYFIIHLSSCPSFWGPLHLRRGRAVAQGAVRARGDRADAGAELDRKRGAGSVPHHAGAGPDRTRSIHYVSTEESARSAHAAARTASAIASATRMEVALFMICLPLPPFLGTHIPQYHEQQARRQRVWAPGSYNEGTSQCFPLCVKE